MGPGHLTQLGRGSVQRIRPARPSGRHRMAQDETPRPRPTPAGRASDDPTPNGAAASQPVSDPSGAAATETSGGAPDSGSPDRAHPPDQDATTALPMSTLESMATTKLRVLPGPELDNHATQAMPPAPRRHFGPPPGWAEGPGQPGGYPSGWAPGPGGPGGYPASEPGGPGGYPAGGPGGYLAGELDGSLSGEHNGYPSSGHNGYPAGGPGGYGGPGGFGRPGEFGPPPGALPGWTAATPNGGYGLPPLPGPSASTVEPKGPSNRVLAWMLAGVVALAGGLLFWANRSTAGDVGPLTPVSPGFSSAASPAPAPVPVAAPPPATPPPTPRRVVPVRPPVRATPTVKPTPKTTQSLPSQSAKATTSSKKPKSSQSSSSSFDDNG